MSRHIRFLLMLPRAANACHAPDGCARDSGAPGVDRKLRKVSDIFLAGALLIAWPSLVMSQNEKSECLRVVTINVWSGLDYHGNFDFGEYKPIAWREKRFEGLVHQLRNLDPDIVFIQEANPVAGFSDRLADSLDFDEIHQVCNAGIKLAGIGPPFNFEEGIAIVARKSLRLREFSVWKLSGSFGLYGDDVTLNFDESEFAQAATVIVSGRKVFLVNLHLSAYPPMDSSLSSELRAQLDSGRISMSEFEEASRTLERRSTRRIDEVRNLLKYIRELPKDAPIILGGDFNAEASSREVGMIVENKDLVDAGAGLHRSATWDPERNDNIAYSTRFTDARGTELDLDEKLSAVYDSKARAIDYIFLNRQFDAGKSKSSGIVLDSTFDGVHVSDHFGLMTAAYLHLWGANEEEERPDYQRSNIEPLPIVSYDTDIGMGYGAKLFLFDILGSKESFDFVAFNSTKGERWYRGVFSYPDLEWREGREYPIALDLIFDYDKWLKNNFYGVGNESSFADREQYTRVPIELSASLSRGVTPELVGQFIVRYRSIENLGFENGSRLWLTSPSLNAATVRYTSANVNLRYDTRNSYVNASRGIVLSAESEYAPGGFGNVSFLRLAGWFQYYRTLFYPTTVFALRAGVQQVSGNNLPIQVLSSIGGNNTMRGFTQDRFLDKAACLVNMELRFPIVWRIGGIAGMDAGKVWPTVSKADLTRWASNPVAGLRLYMDNFVVRADLGFGPEGTGFYFNFGHMF